jgi:penicillin-binding protein 1A
VKLGRLVVKSLLVLLLLVGAFVFAAIVGTVWYIEYGMDLPDLRKSVSNVAARPICAPDTERNFVPLAAIPATVREAFLAIEQPHFYDRPPFNPIVEYGEAIFFGRMPDNHGISQAVARCLESSSADCCRPTLNRAMRTIVLMRRIERDLPKDMVLEIYLNEVWLGRGAYGAASAATAYFGKPMTDLSIAEAAYVAALTRNPTLARGSNERGARRRNFVIDRMVATAAIDSEQGASAKQQPLILRDIASGH